VQQNVSQSPVAIIAHAESTDHAIQPQIWDASNPGLLLNKAVISPKLDDVAAGREDILKTRQSLTKKID
jgi:hypothetical protein